MRRLDDDLQRYEDEQMIGPGRLGNTGSAASGTAATDRKDESTNAAASTTTTSSKKRTEILFVIISDANCHYEQELKERLTCNVQLVHLVYCLASSSNADGAPAPKSKSLGNLNPADGIN